MTTEEWRQAYERATKREVPAETLSGLRLEPLYEPADGDVADRVGRPGLPPYTRGPYASMYRSKLWTTRLFAGFGTASETNARLHQLVREGADGLSTAFDLPTLMGRDSDDPLSAGEVGRCGVAIDTVVDMEDLYAGIDLDTMTTSMTINGPAAVVLAMHVVAAENRSVPRARLAGTIQNDILKEYQAQKEFIFPPGPSMRLVTDVARFCVAEMPRWYPLSVSGYHIREAGATAVDELGFTLANGFAYVEAGQRSGLAVDEIAPRLSFFFNAHIDFFEEVAKYRAARRIWARWLHERYGARHPRSLQCRFHAQTAGVSLSAQQPEVNVVRTTLEALAAVLGGAQSLHTNGWDEVLALPSERSARLALRTQQVIAHETGVPLVVDPLGGSWLVESLTDQLEARAEAVFAEVERLGRGSMLDGVYAGIESGWFEARIAEAAYAFERKVDRGQRVIVGVNRFVDGEDPPDEEVLRVDPGVEDRQRHRLAKVRRSRSTERVAEARRWLAEEAASPDHNLVPAIIEAVRSYATEGEIVETLAEVFGRWRENAVI